MKGRNATGKQVSLLNEKLDNHTSRYHSSYQRVSQTPGSSSKRVLCPLSREYRCSQQLSSTSHAKRHARIHSGVKEYICPECNQEFTRKDNMQQHRNKRHLDSKGTLAKQRPGSMNLATVDDKQSAYLYRRQHGCFEISCSHLGDPSADEWTAHVRIDPAEQQKYKGGVFQVHLSLIHI